MTKPSLDGILQGLLAKGKAKPPKPLVLAPKAEASQEPKRPLLELLGNVLPPVTEFEKELERAKLARQLRPRDSPGPDPRVPWAGKGLMQVQTLTEAPHLTSEAWAKGQEKIALNNAIAQAKRGKRLTLAQRKLLGKWELQRIMARVRPKGGDYG